MDSSSTTFLKETTVTMDEASEEEYAFQSKLLQDFINISTIDKAWTFSSNNGNQSQAMFSVSQPNLLANKKRRHVLSSHIFKENNGVVSFQWAPFSIELTNVTTIVPSPSGSKLLVVRNPENESPTQFEIWSASQFEKEFHIPNIVHGSVYCDGWFEGISWTEDESLIAYVAEEPAPYKPTFNSFGYKKGGSPDKDFGSWKGQGDWEEDWGETYAGKRRPALFVINTNSGEVRGVEGIAKSLSVGQVVWVPSTNGLNQKLVFVGWSANLRKLGIKYCYNRPCALYSVRSPFFESEDKEIHPKEKANEDICVINLTQSISSAYFPRFRYQYSAYFASQLHEIFAFLSLPNPLPLKVFVSLSRLM